MSRKKNIAGFVRDLKACLGLEFLKRGALHLSGAGKVLLGLAIFLSTAGIIEGSALAWELPKDARLMGREKQISIDPAGSLYEIARANGFALEHIASANGLSASATSAGRSTLVLPSRRILPFQPPNPGIVINLPELGGYVLDGKTTIFFPLAIGKPGRFATPTGSFTIVEKVVDPDWIAPEWAGLGEENVVKAGPDNPLGDRWIGLSSPGLGMHSTNTPSSIGSASSHGCMRMYPEVARTIFELVKTGWPVRIEYETVRLGLDRSGIYISAFPDVYLRVDSAKALRQKFKAQDLQGFYAEALCAPILEAKTGNAVKVVDLSPKVWVGNKWFPAARIGSTLYLEQDSLKATSTAVSYSLFERTVQLSRGEHKAVVGLYLDSGGERDKEEAFLSRGSCWFPARKTIEALGLSASWEASENRLRIGS